MKKGDVEEQRGGKRRREVNAESEELNPVGVRWSRVFYCTIGLCPQ